MRTAEGMKTYVSMAVIAMLFFQLVLMVSDNAIANLAGDENQLPQNEELIDLKNGASNNLCYYKGNYLVWGTTSGQSQGFFDGTHNMGRINEDQSPNKFISVRFPYPLKISRIRIYPMGNSPQGVGDLLGCDSVTISNIAHFWLGPTGQAGYYGADIFTSNTNGINQKTDFIQVLLTNFITMELVIKCESNSPVYLNEIEIYYDNTYNPYPSSSEIKNFHNYTNITNEYFNETYNIYENKTYQNDTYYNETYVDNTYLEVTYLNKTYQNDTYTGNYTDYTYSNTTYLNQTNQTGGTSHQNTTNEFVNNTYLNETALQDNERLEDKINRIMDQLNNSKEPGTKETKSVVDESYFSPLLIILLIAIIIFQFILLLQGRKKKEQQHKKEPVIKGEVEYTPEMGFIREEEQAIFGGVQQPCGEITYSDYPSSEHPYSYPPPQPPHHTVPSEPNEQRVLPEHGSSDGFVSPRDKKEMDDDYQPAVGIFTVESTITCKICLGNIKDNAQGYRCPCGNVYHPSCVGRVGECPLCKLEINKKDVGFKAEKIRIIPVMDDDYQPPKYTGDILTSQPEDSEFPLVITTGDVSTPQGCYHLYNMLLAKKGSGIRISQESSRDEINKARKQIIMMYHPDKWQDDEEKATFFMQKINVAWELLSNEKGIDKTFRV